MGRVVLNKEIIQLDSELINVLENIRVGTGGPERWLMLHPWHHCRTLGL